MSAALSMPNPMQHPMIGPYTVEEWLAVDPPVDGSCLELIFGYLHVTPAPSGKHQYAASRLIRPLEDAIAAANRTDLYVVAAVNVQISTAWRTALIPDVVILNTRPDAVSFPADALALAVEIWSPGNPRAERDTKMAAYADAGVPFLWTLDQGNQLRDLTLTAYRLENDHYVEESTIQAGTPTGIEASPIPVTLDLNKLLA
ncbi:Uma2 family endonuclease [Amycolatopsis sp. cg5]|uniref:Uma2 family endonuclease n=1 Tax=Amycolatopsis sp. cg5 TaxID=3238802 RepID=UPI0035258143